MDEIFDLLSDAKDEIDGEMDAHTPECRAMSRMHDAIKQLARVVRDLRERGAVED